jgi:hypothetical protein
MSPAETMGERWAVSSNDGIDKKEESCSQRSGHSIQMNAILSRTLGNSDDIRMLFLEETKQVLLV